VQQSRTHREAKQYNGGPRDEDCVRACGGGVHQELLLHVPHGEPAHGRPRRERAGARAGQRPQGKGDGARAHQDAGRQGACRAGRIHRRQARRRHQQGHVAPPRRRAQAHAHQRWRALGVDQG
jgi:hypothetical protein